MPKKTAMMTVETLSERIDELEARLTALEGAKAEGGTDAVEIPTPDDVGGLDKKVISTLATQLGIETDGVSPKALKALIATAAAIHHDEGVDELDEDAVTALAEACGIPAGKPAKMLAALKKYLDAAKDTEADEAEESEEESEDEESEDEESEDEESEDEESEDEDEEDEKPKKGKKKPAKDDEESDDDDSDDEEGDDDDEEEVTFTPKQVAAYNKVAKKPVKNAEALTALCTDDEGTVHAWGTAYVKGETAYCCGMPLKDTKATVDGEKIEVGKCAVTGQLFKQDEDGELVEVEAD